MIREIVRPRERQLKISIPPDYVDKDLEILVLPFFEMQTTARKEFSGPDKDLQKLFANARNIKIDPSIDIDAMMNEINDVVL